LVRNFILDDEHLNRIEGIRKRLQKKYRKAPYEEQLNGVRNF